MSTHSTFGGAAATVLRAWNGGDKINATLSSTVTLDNRGVITRTYTSLKAAAEENSRSRVFGGVCCLPYLFIGFDACKERVGEADVTCVDRFTLPLPVLRVLR